MRRATTNRQGSGLRGIPTTKNPKEEEQQEDDGQVQTERYEIMVPGRQ